MNLKSFIIFFTAMFAFIVWACPAISQMTGAEKASAYEAYIDDLIQKCEKKYAMIDSESSNLRNEVKTALMKASFYKKNKEILIEDMVKYNIDAKPYVVQHFLNERFFAIVRDHNPKVAEAYSAPDSDFK